MFGLGIGITVIFILVALIIVFKQNGLSLPQVFFGIFLGLLLASVSPGLPKATHDFITSSTNSIMNIDTSK